MVVGQDQDGNDVIDAPIAYLSGDMDGEGPARPLTATFEPAGCGRALYSTYHTTATAHPGLLPQERALLYVIMEIGACRQGAVPD